MMTNTKMDFAVNIRKLKAREKSTSQSIKNLGVFPDVTCCWTRFGLDSALYREQGLFALKANTINTNIKK